MIDLKEYDEGASKYLADLKLNRLPLYSWDFYGEYLQSLSKGFSDAKYLSNLAAQNQWVTELDFEEELKKDTVIVVTDANLKIVFSSQNMIKMNGYKQNEVVGNSPKMFQGKRTSKIVTNTIRKAILAQKPFDEWLINYNKNGKPYNCHIKGFPIFNSNGQLSHFVALEKAA